MSAPKLHRTTVPLAGLNDAEHTMPAWAIEGVDGLVTCHEWGFLSGEVLDTWMVVHAASGVAVIIRLDTRREAVAVAQDLTTYGVDWTRSIHELRGDRDVGYAVTAAAGLKTGRSS